MQKISGEKIAEQMIGRLRQMNIPRKKFVAVLVGSDPVSRSFLKKKAEVADALGVDFELVEFPETLSSDALRREIGVLARKSRVGGVVLQLPLPGSINAQYVLNAIPREKDVDVLGERALGAFYTGRSRVLPPAALAASTILKELDIQLEGKKVAIVGLGRLVGKPLAVWLVGRASTIVLVDKGGDYGLLKEADIVMAGTGVPGLITTSMVKDGAVVIDFGYASKVDEDGVRILKGDFDPKETKVHAYTPTPKGTGPVLVTCLFENFYTLNQ